MEKYRKRIHQNVWELVIAAIVIFASFFVALASMEDVFLKQKVIEYERHLEIIAECVDFNISVNGSPYREERLQDTMAMIDAYPFTYAELFKYEDGALMGNSGRTPSYTAAFSPLGNPKFMAEAMSRFESRDETYTIPVWWKGDGIPGRTVYVSYRWTPVKHEEVSYLLVTGVSSYTLDVHVPSHAYIIMSGGLVWLGALACRIYRNINKFNLAKMKSQFTSRYREGGDADDCER